MIGAPLTLILHELLHISLNHFTLADTFGIAQRSRPRARPLVKLPTEVYHLVPLALELQADHDALCVSLGGYASKKGWNDLRRRCAAITAMLVLIECEETKLDLLERSHPNAATRIFQLLGHLAEMPLVQAQVDQDASLIPVEEELQAFSRDVTIPCFFDAIQLAQASGAASIADDLGSPEAFFRDLEIAKLGDPSRYADLKTQGARQWAELRPCNEALKTIVGNYLLTE